MLLSTGKQQLCLHAHLLPLPHAHGLPHLPPREGAYPLPRTLCVSFGEGNLSRLGAPMWDLGTLKPVAMLSGPLQVDLAVVEVGIGGAYDCTNIVR